VIHGHLDCSSVCTFVKVMSAVVRNATCVCFKSHKIYKHCFSWRKLLWTVLNNAIYIWNLLLYYIKMWAAFLMRILRKRIVLGVIFALSLTYCILSFLREVRNCASLYNDHSHRVISITLEKWFVISLFSLVFITDCCCLYQILA